MGDSNLEAGRYKMAFIDYLQKVENLCQCKELLELYNHLLDMQKAYGDKLITVFEYRDEFLFLCEMLREKHGLTVDFNEAFSRVEIDYEMRRVEEDFAYRRLKMAIHGYFGTTTKIVQFHSNTCQTMDLRAILTTDADAVARRKCFRRLLKRESDPLSPFVMERYFQDEIYEAYDNVTKLFLP